jgi:signal transduction histidine kinase
MSECPTATDRDRDRPTRDDDHPVRRGGFFVADDGSGILADERDDVFESGFSTGEDSTGFGLSIVQSIVEAHGWDVAVTDRIDGTSGARFEITGVEYAETNNGERPDSVAVGKEGGTADESDGR